MRMSRLDVLLGSSLGILVVIASSSGAAPSRDAAPVGPSKTFQVPGVTVGLTGSIGAAVSTAPPREGGPSEGIRSRDLPPVHDP